MGRVYVTTSGRRGTPFGCLGTLFAFFLLIVFVVAVAVGAVVLLAIAGAVLLVMLVAFAIDRLLLALSPSRRARRDLVRSGGVIDATAYEDRPDGRDGSPPDEPPELSP